VEPSFFGAKPEMVTKGGYIVGAQMGDANASIPTPKPLCYRPMFARLVHAVRMTSVGFASQ
jgi:urease subunit alpha